MMRALLKACLLLALSPTLLSCGGVSAQEPFYLASQGDLAGKPGTIIRQEPAVGAPDGASASRILYRSTGLKGESIAVSALVVIPQGASPPGGRPIVAWAHPTSGTVQKCAPSLARHKFDGIQGLAKMIGRGYVVVATDYPGLGTGGTHPYLVGVSEARSVIDSVRAARTLPDAGGGSRYAAWGHSQGGQAVLFTGLLARSYAPELELVGVAAAAPATDLGTLMRDDFATTGGKNLTAMTLWSWARIYGAPIDKVVEPAAMPTVDALANECLETIFDFLERQHTGKPLATTFLSVPDVTRIEPWQSLMKENTPGPLPHRMPVFLAQGIGDTTVRPAVTESYMQSLCKAGSPVRMLALPKVGHAFIGRDSASAAVDWMTDRFDGRPTASDC
jgi:acetyl esterase/lipase